jgi:hypothetical protein
VIVFKKFLRLDGTIKHGPKPGHHKAKDYNYSNEDELLQKSWEEDGGRSKEEYANVVAGDFLCQVVVFCDVTNQVDNDVGGTCAHMSAKL